MPKKGNELFYLDAQGEKQDQDLHPEAPADPMAYNDIGWRNGKILKLPDALLRQLYGPPR